MNLTEKSLLVEMSSFNEKSRILPTSSCDVREKPGTIDEYERPVAKEGDASVLQAAWNICNCVFGVGIITIPYAVREGGLIASVLIFVTACIIDNYTSKVLALCLYDDVLEPDGTYRTVRVRSSYADIAEACWKSFGRKMIITIQLIYVTAVATLYLELSGFILVETFPQAGISQLQWTVLSTLFVTPTIFLRTLTRISWSSMLAVVSVSSMFAGVLAYSIHEMENSDWKFTLDHKITIESFTICCGVLLFNFEASFAIAGVEESMRERSKFNKMVNWSYVFCTFFLLLYSIPPYLAFGDNTREFITYNLPSNAIHTIISLLLVAKALFTYPLFFFFIIDNIDLLKFRFLPPCYGRTQKEFPSPWAMIFRVVIILFCLFLAIVVPHFSKFMGFIGSLVSPWMSFICPCAFYVILKRHDIGRCELIINMVIIVIATLICVVFSILSFRELVRSFKTEN
ncbi:vesicular inhibitory amino acid transporter-like [Ptychodera flava]|uniref:vesicular inhibitory amino acid transporter-like n=1 Tax=Ptychodera flava TaxID=63121 RepID=UPI00396A667A